MTVPEEPAPSSGRVGAGSVAGRAAVALAVGVLVGMLALGLAAPAAAAAENATQANGTADGENVTRIYGDDVGQVYEDLPDLVRTPDGGALAVEVTANGTFESSVLRVGADGDVVATATVPGILQDVERVAEGEYAAVGERDGDALLVRFDEDGSLRWNRTYGGDGRDLALDVASAPDGDAYLLASTESFGVNTSDLWVVRVDPGGDVVWDRLVAHEKWTAFPEGVQLSDGSLVATIRTERSMNKTVDGQQNVSVVRMAPDGEVEWRTVVVGNGRPNDKEEMFDVVPAHGDGVLIAGASNSGGDGESSFDYWAARLDADGELRWQRQYEVATREFANAAVRTADGYVLAGFTEREDGPVVGKLLAIDADGNERFTTTYAPPSRLDSRIGGVDWTADGRLLVGGASVNEDANPPRGANWILDVTGSVPQLSPAPSIWESQRPDADAGDGQEPTTTGAGPARTTADATPSPGTTDGAAGDPGTTAGTSGTSGDGSTTGDGETTRGDGTSMDPVLYAVAGVPLLALVAWFGVRRFGSA